MNAAADSPEVDAGVESSADGPVFTVKLSRPEKLNALTPDMHLALQRAFDRFEADNCLRVAILAAHGRAFCVGSDLKAASERRARGGGPLSLPPGGYGGIALRSGRTKPVIAAVSGDAVGGGFELALACDLIVATDNSRFALPEPGFGMVAIGGGPHRLVRAVGANRAMDILLTGRFLSAAEATEMGIVNRLVGAGELDECVRELAATVLRGGPGAIAATLQLVHSTFDYPSLGDAMARQEDQAAFRRWRASNESREGASAFAEKREPAWRTS